MDQTGQINQLIHDRQLFEDEMYDLLVSPFQFIPESFWESIKLSYDINLLVNIYNNDTCIICANEMYHFKEMSCCKHNMCIDCCTSWFSISVRCPYCYNDLRN